MLRQASETRVYLGNIPRDVDRRDIENFFYGYGDIAEIKLMCGFAFVEFKNARDAKDAVQDLDGKKMLGERINIEFARGGRNRREDFRNRDPGIRNYPRPRRTGYRIIVENLSQNVSWQDLKDFMRTAGEVTYADCSRDGSGKGIVEFETEEDLRTALRKLDGAEFKGSEVILREDMDPSRPRSRSPRRNRSPPRYRDYNKGYDRYDRRSPRYHRDDRDNNYYRRDDYPNRRGYRDERPFRGGSPYERSPVCDRSRERSIERFRERSQTRSLARSPMTRSPKDFSQREGSARSPIDDSMRDQEY